MPFGSDYDVEVRDYSLSMYLWVKSHQWQKICSIKSPRALDCHEIRRYFSCPQLKRLIADIALPNQSTEIITKKC